jgi:hypothetical protein
MNDLRDQVFAGDVRDAVAAWVARRTSDERLAAEIRLLTPSELLVRCHRAAVRRRKPRKVRRLGGLNREDRRRMREIVEGMKNLPKATKRAIDKMNFGEHP